MFAVLDYLYGFAWENCAFNWEHNSDFSTIFNQAGSRIFPSQTYDIFAAGNAFVYLAGAVSHLAVQVSDEFLNIGPSFRRHWIAIFAVGIKHSHQGLEGRTGVNRIAKSDFSLQFWVQQISKTIYFHITF
ncbi:hypothetical protein SDC9_160334 [bioreactor metagenome]|uniref:Uncharacterized protein n=1 Tax=bioreactor metagenome TaxID=1076179 RepID=A0A645FKS0_9ZZZZ